MIHQLTLSAIFIALSVALGFALVHVPNIELVTMTIFSAGFLLGPRRGFVIGLCAMSLFTSFNPMGAPVPVVALSQVVAMALIGWIGGLSQRWVNRGRHWARMALFGLGCTLFYDVITNLAMAIAFGLWSRATAVLVAGLTFSFLHLVSNAIIFSIAGPFLSKTRARIRIENTSAGEKYRQRTDCHSQ